jgi:hypothetical protein
LAIRAARKWKSTHDPEKRAAVFRKDHAKTKSQGAIMIHPQIIAP